MLRHYSSLAKFDWMSILAFQFLSFNSLMIISVIDPLMSVRGIRSTTFISSTSWDSSSSPSACFLGAAPRIGAGGV